MIHGRQAELQTLSSLLEETKQGKGSCVIIEGPPGIGRSSLVNEFVVGVTDCVTMKGCMLEGEAEPFGLFNRAIAGTSISPLSFPGKETSFSQLTLLDENGVILAESSQGLEGGGNISDTLTTVQDFIKFSFQDLKGKGLGLIQCGQMDVVVEHEENFTLIG